MAPLGTNLTNEQAGQLRTLGIDPIIATDADVAGQVAAQRDYWILTPHLLQPRHAALPEGSDPAELVATGNTQQLLDALDHARPLADVLIEERFTNLPPTQAALAATVVIAAQPVDAWEPSVHTVAERIGVDADADVIRTTVWPFIHAWNNDPARLADPATRPHHPGPGPAHRSCECPPLRDPRHPGRSPPGRRPPLAAAGRGPS